MNNIFIKLKYLIIVFVLGTFFFILPKTASADTCTQIDFSPIGWSYESQICNGTTPPHVNAGCTNVVSNGQKTGTVCCTSPRYSADYCSSQTIPGHWEIVANGAQLWIPDFSDWSCCIISTPTPTPVPCVQSGGSCIASYPCNPGRVPSTLSCGASGVCCVAAPTSTPTATNTPTPTPDPCPYTACGTCLSHNDSPSFCNWGRLSGSSSACYSSSSTSCPAGFAEWKWAGCSASDETCSVPTATPTPLPGTTPIPTPIPTSVPTLPPGITPTPTSAPTPTPVITSTPVPTRVPTVTPTPPPPALYNTSVTGNVYIDNNGNKSFDAGDTPYNGSSVKIHLLNNASTGCNGNLLGIVSAASTSISFPYYDNGNWTGYGNYDNGKYRFTLRMHDYPEQSPTYAICLENNTGLSVSFPTNRIMPHYLFWIGYQCLSDGLYPSPPPGDQTCSGNTPTNLNFGLTYRPWFQSIGSDMRWDSGFNNPLPSADKYASIPGTGGMPGIIFSGGRGLSADFGAGQASENRFNWKVGSFRYPDVYTDNHGLVYTSYRFLLETVDKSVIPKKTIGELCTSWDYAGNCTLNLSVVHGVYWIEGMGGRNLTLNGTGYTFLPNQNYVILINGNLNIRENIYVPVGSTVIFSAKGNITVGSNVTEIQGLYSADNNFIADGSNSCPTIDLRLNVAGSVVANAGRTGGTFANRRDLCSQNATLPSVTFTERPDFMLNYPDLAKYDPRSWREVAP